MRVVWIVFTVCVLKCSAMTRRELEEFSDYLFQTSQMDLSVKKGSSPDDDLFDDDEAISDHAWEDSGKFEGDLILNDRQRRLIVENVEGLSRNGLTDSTKRWPNNELIYFIQREHFNSEQVNAIERGIEDLAQASCVKFREYRKGDMDAVVIQGSRRGCFAQVGYQGGYQVLNLSGRHPAGRGCFRHGTVVHELLHTLGFYHMQSSPDRDDYISVKWENILQPTRHNFRKYNSFSVSDFGVGYDYDSVLHYSRKAFSSNGKDTLVPKQSGVSIGQRRGLSDKDTQKLNKMYCDGDSNNFEMDDGIQKEKKKKKPKNQPFDGHGIGYQKGKTVVIKLPTTSEGKLPHVASLEAIQDFSKSQLHNEPSERSVLYRGLQYPYTPEQTKLKLPEIVSDDHDERSIDVAHWKAPLHSEKTKNEQTFAEAYEKLAQKVYGEDYPAYKTDHSEFYSLPEYKGEGEEPNEKFITMAEELSNEDTSRDPIKITHNHESHKTSESPDGFEDTDSSYRTRQPFKNVYTSNQRSERPKFTLKYLKNRENYDNSPKINEQTRQRSLFSPAGGSSWSEVAKKHNTADNSPFTGHVMEHKSIGHLRTGDHFVPEAKKSKVYGSEEFYNDLSIMPFFGKPGRTRGGKLLKSYHTADGYNGSSESQQKSRVFSVFDYPVTVSDSWYKPVYSNIEQVTRSYSEDDTIS